MDELQRSLHGFTPKILMDIINPMLRKNMIELLKRADGILLYRAVTKSESKKLSSLAADEKIVYQCIKAANVDGIWIKVLKGKTDLHQAVLNKCIKTLEQKQLIKPFKSIKVCHMRTPDPSDH